MLVRSESANPLAMALLLVAAATVGTLPILSALARAAFSRPGRNRQTPSVRLTSPSKTWSGSSRLASRIVLASRPIR
jgi:hypothetical protein